MTAGPRPRPASWKALRVPVAMVAGVAIVLGLVVAVQRWPAASAPDAPAESLQPSTTAPVTRSLSDVGFGVFLETRPEEVADFEAWVGRDVDHVVDFPARTSWEEIADPQYLLDAWDGQDARLVLTVALLPSEDPSATIEQGAAGAYDQYYVELAERLVASGYEDAVLRIGWEFNIRESRWFTEDIDAYVTYFRRAVEAVRSVEGESFAIDWNVNNGSSPIDASLYWPGGDHVDIVGVDVYDVSGRAYPYPADCDAACRQQRQDEAWSGSIYGHERGLRFWADFAREHDKPLSLPEWGLWTHPEGIGGGENPSFIRRIHAFAHDEANNVQYQAYFEFDLDDDYRHSLQDSFPESGAVFQELFVPR